MDTLIQQLINGLSLGSVYALVALGYTMVYGIINLLNFAHGDVYMVGAFVGYYIITNFNLGFLPTLILTMLITGILGLVIYQVAYRPLRNSTRIASLITAIGMSYLLQNGMIYIAGPQTRSFPQIINNQLYKFGAIQISTMQLLMLATTILLMIALQLIVQQTKFGKAMRAVSNDPEAAQLMGINSNQVISFTFFLGSMLAGAGGMLVGMYYNTITPTMGAGPGLKAFIAAVVGGIGSVPGAMLGGYLIGITEVMISAFGNSMIRDAVVYLILIIILLVRPSGILGKYEPEKV
ncbi:amino acid/amide ABC transporter membrane protein 1, HAAT family (TC 3.A.1.4.-) [Atopostipes suicloacalis DSM 15692]|uniref:Amino acid/amide ABC transporter membrane protein 1, HAAT family (TC 3.A.1.4.-) n=1 Tax=Atopostipes suicloacalis DSM 15692 TaxID=1121025 RepID=A0A1M4XXS7_9LACT|nr:branched-chain amino acid ABC transporter permease [Atopostipes suicloacalis]SHE98113.1 amino acid/amide ABC transporter membrane protein 1, HAAT family (TC 3.A.1.4.-) [Atopostipes suicloacalis DSM 15692]